MLSLHQLTYKINNKVLFDSLNITFLPSSITYLKGKNGSGKTSLLRMIAGIQNPTSGNIYFNQSQEIQSTYIGHKLGLKQEFTVFENLKFWSTIYNSTETLEASIHYFSLHDILDQKYYQLSAGNQKKVALSKLISCNSNLWLLDEAESNLDQDNIKLLHNLIISKANNGGIILISTHGDSTIKSAQTLCLEDYSQSL